ncbi:MAG: DUF3592 domain-containing protein [Aureispira sp.]
MLAPAVVFIIIAPFFIVSYYLDWPLGIFGNLLYFLITFRLAGHSEQRWENAGHLVLLTFPFIYSLFLVVDAVPTAVLLLLVSSLLSIKFYIVYKEVTLNLQLAKFWKAFTVYLPEETPDFTFEGTVKIDSTITQKSVDMPAKRFFFPISYTVDGVVYQQDYEFLWTNFTCDTTDLLDDYQGQVAGRSLQLYYNPKNPQEVRRAPSEHYDPSYLNSLLQAERSRFIIPITWAIIGISLLIGNFLFNF